MPRRTTVPSTLRTFRLPTEVIQQLQVIADERGVKLNSLVSKLLEQYLDWGIFVDRYGMVTLSRDTYRLLLDEIDPHRMDELAAKVSKHVEEYALLKFKKLSTESILSVFQDYSQYANLGTSTMSREGDEVVITADHPHGMNHSLISKRVTESLLTDSTGVKPQIMITENIAICRVKMPQASPSKAAK